MVFSSVCDQASLQTQSDLCFVFFFKEKVDILNIFAQLDIFYRHIAIIY